MGQTSSLTSEGSQMGSVPSIPVVRYDSNWNAEKFDSILKKTEGYCQIMLSGTSMAKSIAARNFMDTLTQAQMFIEGLLEGETGSPQRPRLREIFGGDCCRIAHLLGILESKGISAALNDFPNLKDNSKFTQCRNQCKALVEILERMGLRQQLEEARRRARCHAILEKIDNHDDAQDPATIAKMEELFRIFDQNGDGQLSGDEVKQFLPVLVSYVNDENKRRADMMGCPWMLTPEEMIKDWVRGKMDPDGDGVITLKEALRGLKVIVDDIEVKPEVMRKTSSLESRRSSEVEASA